MNNSSFFYHLTPYPKEYEINIYIKYKDDNNVSYLYKVFNSIGKIKGLGMYS